MPVEALYDREVALEVIFRNLLQREGYASLHAVRAEEQRTAIDDSLIARGLSADDELRTALAGISDPQILKLLLRRVATATWTAEFLADLRGRDSL